MHTKDKEINKVWFSDPQSHNPQIIQIISESHRK